MGAKGKDAAWTSVNKDGKETHTLLMTTKRVLTRETKASVVSKNGRRRWRRLHRRRITEGWRRGRVPGRYGEEEPAP